MFSSIPFFKPTPESLVRKVDDLPPTPKVLHTLQRMIAVPEVSIDMIAEVLALEPGLSARIVKIASSTYFGAGAQVDSISEAIQRVGIVGVQELVTYSVASRLVGQPLATYGISAQDLWYRAVACALAASSLADRCDVDRNDAYTAGLMHGLGLLVIDRYAVKQIGSRRIVSAGYPDDSAPEERAWLGFSHAETGGALMEMWGFSEAVSAAVRFQLNPEAAGEHRKLAMVLATARWARSLFCIPDNTIPELPSPVWLEESGVQIEDFSEWLGQVRYRYTIACDELRLS